MVQINKTFAVLAAGAALAFAGTAAQATTYANANDAGNVYSFGSPDTTSYGQVFTAPGGSLQSWAFYTSDSSTNNAKLVIANWDGGKAVGPALYEGLLNTTAVSGSYFEHLYSGINLSLTSGTSYIAYLTVAGVANPASGVTFAASGTSPLDGGFRFLNSGGTDPLSLNANWSGWYNPHVQYTAVFGEGAVPEPASWAMMIGGFAIAGAAMRRRSAKVAFA